MQGAVYVAERVKKAYKILLAISCCSPAFPSKRDFCHGWLECKFEDYQDILILLVCREQFM